MTLHQTLWVLGRHRIRLGEASMSAKGVTEMCMQSTIGQRSGEVSSPFWSLYRPELTTSESLVGWRNWWKRHS